MPTITPVNIQANIEKNSASTTLPSSVSSLQVQLTDSTGNTVPAANSNWRNTVGNIIQYGVQISFDNGTTWDWWLSDAPDGTPFGRLTKDGQMPFVAASSSGSLAPAGALFRLGIITDTNIKLGCVITTG